MNTIKLSQAAQANVAETGCDPVADLAEIKRCKTTREEFLAYCLNGADRDRERGWRDYVDALFALVEQKYKFALVSDVTPNRAKIEQLSTSEGGLNTDEAAADWRIVSVVGVCDVGERRPCDGNTVWGDE